MCCSLLFAVCCLLRVVACWLCVVGCVLLVVLGCGRFWCWLDARCTLCVAGYCLRFARYCVLSVDLFVCCALSVARGLIICVLGYVLFVVCCSGCNVYCLLRHVFACCVSKVGY